MKKLESALVLRMVFRKFRQCSINHECNVAGSSKQLTFFLCTCSRIAGIVDTEGRDAENLGVLQTLHFHKP